MVGDDTPALEAVLDVLEERRDLMREIKEIEAAEGEATGRLAQIHDRLVEIDADAKPSQAAEILHGLGLVHILLICLSNFNYSNIPSKLSNLVTLGNKKILAKIDITGQFSKEML